jgi:3-oxoacyl-[acyl-carrier protein] reductase
MSLLVDKRAVIYGGGGAIGGAVARAFAREGAVVFIGGRSLDALEKTARDIRADGGVVHCAAVDALDERSLAEHAAAVVKKVGGIDISFNAIGWQDVQGKPLVEMELDDVARPIAIGTRTQLLTAKAVAPHMQKRGSGVIMTITATPARMAFPRCGGFAIACAAVEGMCRSLAAELGPLGIRVICLRSAGSPESIPDTMNDHATGNQISGDEFIANLEEMALLRRLPALTDVGRVAAIMASEYASTMTGTVANMTCGQVTD